MSGRRWAALAGVFLVSVVGGAIAAIPVVRGRWRAREMNLVVEGREVAGRRGCFACHGEGGEAPIMNPGEGVVPKLSESRSTLAIRKIIVDGEGTNGRFPMPAYGEVLSGRELDALVAFIEALAGLGGPPEGSRATRGRILAREKGCFACHGIDGAGLVANPGSLKGYIPGWRGPDFDELVRDDAELRSWILEGGIPRLAGDEGAMRFIQAQRTPMPRYAGVLTEEDLGAIIDYIKWLRSRRGEEGEARS